MHHKSYLLCPPVTGQTAVSPVSVAKSVKLSSVFPSKTFWRQTTQLLSNVSPKRDCGTKRVTINNTLIHAYIMLRAHRVDVCMISLQLCRPFFFLRARSATRPSFYARGPENPRGLKETAPAYIYIYTSYLVRILNFEPLFRKRRAIFHGVTDVAGLHARLRQPQRVGKRSHQHTPFENNRQKKGKVFFFFFARMANVTRQPTKLSTNHSVRRTHRGRTPSQQF